MQALRAFLVAAACLLPTTFRAPAMADGKFCDLAAPPANAIVAEDIGHTIYIFPDALPQRFTGCKTWWIETGEKYFLFRLDAGRVTQTIMLREQGEPKFATCTYTDGALAADSPADCMSFENAQSFAEHEMGTADQPKIPAAKDIRTKDPL